MGCCKLNSICAKCCAALLPCFTVRKLKFSVLNHTFDLSTKDISYDEYFSSSILSNCVTQLCKKDFFLVYFNARNLPINKCKIDEFLNGMKRLPDVIAISETKLHANSALNVLHISDYELLRTDSNICAGGVCLYTEDTIKFRLCNDLLLKLKHCKRSMVRSRTQRIESYCSQLYIVTQIKTCFHSRISFVKI